MFVAWTMLPRPSFRDREGASSWKATAALRPGEQLFRQDKKVLWGVVNFSFNDASSSSWCQRGVGASDNFLVDQSRGKVASQGCSMNG